jgi:hypothetical protein
MELPSDLSSETLEPIFHFKNQICAIANAKTRRKMSTRFGVAQDVGLKSDGKVILICLKMFPKNFELLYAFAGKHCCCHQQKMTCNNIFSHEGLDLGK